MTPNQPPTSPQHATHADRFTPVGSAPAATVSPRVAATAIVDPTASISGKARVSDLAHVGGTAQVAEYAHVYGDAIVTGRSRILAGARVGDDAHITDSVIVEGYARIEKRSLLFQNTHVEGYAIIHGAHLYGRTYIAGYGDVATDRHVLTVGPIGSEDRHVTIHRHYDGPDSTMWGNLIHAGCWSGTVDELAERISLTGAHGWNEEVDAARWRADYTAFLHLARARAAEWAAEPLTAADHTRWAAHIAHTQDAE